MKAAVTDYAFVSIQFCLFFCFLFDFNYSLNAIVLVQNIGLFFALLGLLIILLAIFQLNKNLSPFPTPKDNATLLEAGVFKWMRHPIYTGIMLLSFAYSVYQNSLYKLGISLLLLVLFYYKSNYEEARLEQKFPNYKEYKSKTNRFIPWI